MIAQQLMMQVLVLLTGAGVTDACAYLVLQPASAFLAGQGMQANHLQWLHGIGLMQGVQGGWWKSGGASNGRSRAVISTFPAPFS